MDFAEFAIVVILLSGLLGAAMSFEARTKREACAELPSILEGCAVARDPAACEESVREVFSYCEAER